MCNLHSRLQEASIPDLKRKQRSITLLFPSFFDRVSAVNARGGVKIEDVEKDEWLFNVHSGTKDGKWYFVTIQFTNVLSLLDKIARNRRLWDASKLHVNYDKLANEFLRLCEIKLDCECPAQLYWGKAFILSLDKYDAKYGEPERRMPKIRNPKQYGAFCKHIQALMQALPSYRKTLADWLKRFYGKEIEAIEKEQRKAAFGAKAAAAFLQRSKDIQDK